jgi:allantoinase
MYCTPLKRCFLTDGAEVSLSSRCDCHAPSITMRSLVLTSTNVQLPNNEQPVPAIIEVECSSGKILRVTPGKTDGKEYQDLGDVEFWDLGDHFVLPGLVECVSLPQTRNPNSNVDSSAHVHLNEPGRTHWEGFYTGTRAAIAGGFTTVVDMPLNSIPPTTNVENLDMKRSVAQGQCWSDVAFWGGVIPNNQVKSAWYVWYSNV